MKFDGLVIVFEPDYKDRFKRGIEIDKLTCYAYDENDTELKNILLGFTLLPGTDFEYETVEDIEIAVRRVIDTNWESIQLERANVKLERTKELFQNAVTYIKEVTDPREYEKVFKDVIGMIDEEIDSAFEELSEKQADGMKLS